MHKCEVCGNEYDKSFEVHVNGHVHTFDCFECAIHALAPKCVSCGCQVIGHGHEAGERVFCSAHCAHLAGFFELTDRLPSTHVVHV